MHFISVIQARTQAISKIPQRQRRHFEDISGMSLPLCPKSWACTCIGVVEISFLQLGAGAQVAAPLPAAHLHTAATSEERGLHRSPCTLRVFIYSFEGEQFPSQDGSEGRMMSPWLTGLPEGLGRDHS